MAVACGRGETGPTTIRGGRRTVERTPVGAMVFFFDPIAALRGAARCAALVEHATSLAEGHAILTERGIATELGYEQRAAADQPDER
jgi:hypothetical protein